MQTAVYLGCGSDVVPLLALRGSIQKFVLVESQSAFEFGSRVKHSGFFLVLRQTLFAAGFSFSRCVTSTHWLFVNRSTKTIVSVWFECPFPLVLPARLKNEIRDATTLICCGFLPHKSILSLMRSPVRLVTNNATLLDEEDDDDVDIRAFRLWNVIVLPRLWWSKLWTESDVPRMLEFWCLNSMRIRHAREAHRLRLADLSVSNVIQR